MTRRLSHGENEIEMSESSWKNTNLVLLIGKTGVESLDVSDEVTMMMKLGFLQIIEPLCMTDYLL